MEGKKNMRLTLNLPPSINSLYSQNRQGRRFKTNEAKAWETESSFKLMKKRKFGKDKVEVSITYYFKDNRSDLINRSKILIDLLEKMRIVDNDNQVWALHEYKNIDKKRLGVVLDIWEYSE